MRTIWQSLAWKEWHEHKWKLAALLAVLSGVAVCLLVGRTTDTLVTLRVTLAMCSVPLAIFIGLNSASGERSRGTLPFLQALPVPMWRVALHKLVFGLITVIAPALLTLLLVYIGYKCLAAMGFDFSDSVRFGARNDAAFSFHFKNWFIDTGVVLSVLAASFYVWAAAGGVNRKDEISAGAIALVVMAVWCIAVTYTNHRVTRWGELPDGKVADWAAWSEAMTASTLPGGLLATAERSWQYQRDFLVFGVLIAVLMHFVLAIWYILRFGRITNVEVRSPQAVLRCTDQNAWLSPPRTSSVSAISWKQFRESGPILLAGLTGIVGIVGAVYAIAWLEGPIPAGFGRLYTGVATVLGFVMSLVIGIGVCFYDVRPQLNTFWRSRPISPDAWFWCKYITGVAVLLATIYVPVLVIAGLGDTTGHDVLGDTNALVIPLAQIAIFSAAVATTCVFRHAIYAAILSIPVVYIGVLLVWTSLAVANLVGWTDSAPARLLELDELHTAAGLVLSIFISTIAAWLSVRYDWGVKNRY
jgi:hypothetical protein